ncbi:META domain-containing protein [Nocardia sp. NPDC055321]
MSATHRWCGVLLAASVAALAGCSSAAEDDTPPAETPMGKAYVSTEVTGTPIPGGGPLTLTFADNRVTATVGCNTASGPVTIDGHTLTVGEMATTLMGCPGDIAGADEWMDGLLRSGPDWTLDGPDLTLTGNGLTVKLLDRKVAQPDRPLAGTTWVVTALLRPEAEVRSVALDEARPTLTIAPDGAVSGSAGCNRMVGKAAVAGDEVSFEGIGTTKMMCDAAIMEVEQQVLEALNGKTTATIDSDTLTLRNTANGTGLKFRAE